MKPLKVLFTKLHPDAKMPTQAHPGDAGYDLYCVESIAVPYGAVGIVKVGIAIQIPKGYYVELHPRSSLDLQGVKMRIGIIDEGYTGELGAIVTPLINGLYVQKGERIGQLILKKREEVTFIEVDKLQRTERGGKGFGSSGR